MINSLHSTATGSSFIVLMSFGLRPAFSFGLRVDRSEAADLDIELLPLTASAKVDGLAAFGSRTVLEDPVGADDDGSTLVVDRLDRQPGLLHLEDVSLPSAMTARSPRSSFLGGSVEDCTCMMFCLASFSKKLQPRSRWSLIGGGHDGAAIAGMHLDDLALPFGSSRSAKLWGASSAFTRLVL
ncbi:hypothetical protein ACQPTN_32890 [Bradyrhizobium sp. 13971]